ncbi:MAG: DUF4446 family protein [Candidatus Levyibacteriota bacterium]|nr:MAG: DUF4446 family protein [Candidatus Levybacteria bacterium]
MVFNLQLLGLIITIIWLGILTTLFWQFSSHYNNLTRGISTKTLKSILDHILVQLEEAEKNMSLLKIKCDKLEKEGLFHIQKIGLLRFNPFKDTGGDQSFILSLVDANNTGVIITGLYSRSGTRWYAKRVINGKGMEHELSDEEKKVIKEARSTNA